MFFNLEVAVIHCENLKLAYGRQTRIFFSWGSLDDLELAELLEITYGLNDDATRSKVDHRRPYII